MARMLGDRVQMRRATRGISASRRGLGDGKGAIEGLKRVLEISKEIGDYTGDTDALGAIADIYTEIGDLENAEVLRPLPRRPQRRDERQLSERTPPPLTRPRRRRRRARSCIKTRSRAADRPRALLHGFASFKWRLSLLTSGSSGRPPASPGRSRTRWRRTNPERVTVPTLIALIIAEPSSRACALLTFVARGSPRRRPETTAPRVPRVPLSEGR